MAKSSVVTVTSTRQQLSLRQGHTNDPIKFALQLDSAASGPVYIGGSDVTTAIGFKISAGESFSDAIVSPQTAPWIVCASGSIPVILYVSNTND